MPQHKLQCDGALGIWQHIRAWDFGLDMPRCAAPAHGRPGPDAPVQQPGIHPAARLADLAVPAHPLQL